jgi:transcriptional regulator with XRE-family HTH domain
MTIGKRIRTERIERKISQEELAKALSTTKQAIYKYENDIVTNIPMDKVAKIAELFNVTPAYLMGWDEKEPSPAELELTEGEKMLIELFRQIPEEQQQVFLEMGRVFANNLKKD